MTVMDIHIYAPHKHRHQRATQHYTLFVIIPRRIAGVVGVVIVLLIVAGIKPLHVVRGGALHLAAVLVDRVCR
jgi:hypothetical protein